jgi:hypothetical protein
VISNLPFDDWASTLGTERLTSSLIDRFTHHAPILGMNGESYGLATDKRRQQRDAEPNISSEKGGATRNNKNNILKERATLRFAHHQCCLAVQCGSEKKKSSS